MTTHDEPAGSVPPLPHPYSIKQHGVTITNCDSEPVQTPGCIQDRGALVVLRVVDFTVLQVSENSARWLGAAPAELLGQPVARLLGDDGAQQLRRIVDHDPVRDNPTYACTLPARDGRSPLDVIVHASDGVVIVEFEQVAAAASDAPTGNYAIVRRFVRSLQNSASLQDFCQTVTVQVRELTGLDRVMVYRFHADDHGEVVAESKRDDLPAWLGLHYPASDIPRPAREIFRKLWIRPLPDASLPVMELVPLVNPDTGRPLNMTYCALRGASTMYTEYLANMKVAATLTMPLQRDGELWGLIACHHYTPTGFPYPMRAACELLAQVASLQLKAADERGESDYRRHIDGVHDEMLRRAAEEGGLARILDAAEPNLLSGIQAGGAALLYKGRWERMGHTPTEPQLRELARWLAGRLLESTEPDVYATDSLVEHHAPAAAYADCASGMLAAAIGNSGSTMLLWFRPEAAQVIRWGGNPDDKPTVVGPHGPRLTPRKSFELFEQSVRQRSLPWTPGETAAARRLRGLLTELIVRRSEVLVALNDELRTSNAELDAFAYVASHDLKEPLRGISKYAHLLAESVQGLSPEDAERLGRIRRLATRMDNLLNSLLHLSVVGRTTLEMTPVNLGDMLGEALEMLAVRRGDPGIEIVVERPLPTVRCDGIQVREVLMNLVGNALKYNVSQPARAEIGYVDPGEAGAAAALPEHARGQRVYFVRDNGIGIDARHFENIFQLFRRLHGRDEYGGGSGAGLTIVKRIVERHGGSIWLRSAPGTGTTFYFTLAPATPPEAPA